MAVEAVRAAVAEQAAVATATRAHGCCPGGRALLTENELIVSYLSIITFAYFQIIIDLLTIQNYYRLINLPCN